MNIRNLEIINSLNLEENRLKNCICEIEDFISDNYSELKKEVAIEY